MGTKYKEIMRTGAKGFSPCLLFFQCYGPSGVYSSVVSLYKFFPVGFLSGGTVSSLIELSVMHWQKRVQEQSQKTLQRTHFCPLKPALPHHMGFLQI